MSYSSSSNQRKESQYEFLRKMGSPVLATAPMVDQSDLCYRMQTRKYGADITYTQMFNANSFISSKEYREENFTTCPEDRPLIVQFAGNNPQTLLQAAKYVEDKCDAIDINLGCPQAIAKRGKFGAFLMEDLTLLTDMIRTLSQNLKIPVTCKTRIYKSFEKSVKLCETLINAGASLITIHGRTREEKGHNIAEVDWMMIKRLVDHFKGRCPIFANGGIEFYDDIYKCLEVTGAEGVMASEAILENPAFFAKSMENGVYLTQLDLTKEYLLMCRKYPVWQLKSIRSHVLKFLHRYLFIHTDIRIQTAAAGSIEDLLNICNELSEIVIDDSIYTDSWYRRHRKYEVLELVYDSDNTANMTRHEMVKLSQQTMMHRKPKIWDSVEENSCLFESLGMFDEGEEEEEDESVERVIETVEEVFTDC